MDNPSGSGELWQTKMSPTDQLPQDIILEILLRLPVKSTCRFRCVCKLWFSFLTSSNFSVKHLQHSRRQFYLIKVAELIKPEARMGSTLGFPKLEYKFALAPNDNLDQVDNVDHPNPQISRKFCMGDGQLILDMEVVGSVDGLFCISFNGGTCIMMWNPATRQSYQVPSPGVSVFGLWSFSLGLGRYHNYGYKVVRVLYGSDNQLPHSIVKAEVYDLNSNLWCETDDPPKLHFSDFRCGAIANGVPYWQSDYDLLSFDCSDVIIWFDPIHDTFGTMKRPEFDIEEGNCVWKLGVIREALVIFVQKFNEGVDVWMMDQPCGDVPIWTRQFCVERLPYVYSSIECSNDGELLFDTAEGYEERKLCLYNYVRDEIKVVPWMGSRLQAPDEIFLYKESLVSPHPSC